MKQYRNRSSQGPVVLLQFCFLHFSTLFLVYACVCVYVCVCVCVRILAHAHHDMMHVVVRRQQWELVFAFHHVGSADETWVIQLDCRTTSKAQIDTILVSDKFSPNSDFSYGWI